MEVVPETTMNAVSTKQFSQMSEFDVIRGKIAASTNHEFYDRPISYWARQGDRRLPYALLGHTVNELINTPFRELASTPGIGPKKIGSLIELLNRCLAGRSPGSPVHDASPVSLASTDDFDAAAVSESTWEMWRATVRRHALEHQTLGQLARSLRELPTVIWTTTLGEYLDYSLAELRDLKTHGEKRIHTVLEVFFEVHSILLGAVRHPRISLELRPGFVPPIEVWIRGALARDAMPLLQDIRESLTLPLLNQIQIDGGDTVHQLACGRLGIESEPESVRRQAERLDVTRARIYQQLETCAEIMRIRWPEGRRRLDELAGKLSLLAPDDARLRLFEATRWLVFPGREDQRMVTNVLASQTVEDSLSSSS